MDSKDSSAQANALKFLKEYNDFLFSAHEKLRGHDSMILRKNNALSEELKTMQQQLDGASGAWTEAMEKLCHWAWRCGEAEHNLEVLKAQNQQLEQKLNEAQKIIQTQNEQLRQQASQSKDLDLRVSHDRQYFFAYAFPTNKGLHNF